MRVLHVLNELRPSGAEVMLRAAAPYWKTAGVCPEILSKGVKLGAYAPALREAGYHIHHLPFESPSRFLLQFYRFLQSHSFDAVHVHTEHANFWLAGLARLRGIPSIRTVHNVFAFRGTTWLERRTQRYLLRRAGVQHVSIGPSVAQAEQTYYHNPTTLIPNWYDTTRFAPATPGQRSAARRRWDVGRNEFAVVSVGNCSHVKNHAALIEALASLASDHSFVYLHAGEEDASQSERRLAAKRGINRRVRFLGFVEDVPALLHAADVLVMPSLYEGYGMSAIEAMGTATPVLLADVPGLRDIGRISDQIIWTAPEPAALAQALLRIMTMPQRQRVKVGKALFSAARTMHGPEHSIRAYGALYHSLSCRSASPSPTPLVQAAAE